MSYTRYNREMGILPDLFMNIIILSGCRVNELYKEVKKIISLFVHTLEKTSVFLFVDCTERIKEEYVQGVELSVVVAEDLCFARERCEYRTRLLVDNRRVTRYFCVCPLRCSIKENYGNRGLKDARR